jgi:hypothetical protein
MHGTAVAFVSLYSRLASDGHRIRLNLQPDGKLRHRQRWRVAAGDAHEAKLRDDVDVDGSVIIGRGN